jgi:hypothetical protein
MSYPSYDQWKCSPPDEPGPDPVDPHEQCEDALEHAEDEIGQLHRQVEELEIELAALRGKASERMTYGELFSAVQALLPGVDFSVSVNTYRFTHSGAHAPFNEWRVWWKPVRARDPGYHGEQVQGDTAEETLALLRRALAPAASDPTGVGDLVRDADVGF